MLEVEVDALFLHEPHDEVHVGFLILDAVFPVAIRSGEFFGQWKAISG